MTSEKCQSTTDSGTMRFLRSSLLLALSALCINYTWALPRGESRIVGGQFGEWGDFPMIVAVLTRPLIGTSEIMCGGAIINDNHVLTSASCVNGHGALGLKVMAAGLDLWGSAGYEEYRNIQRVFIHEAYDNMTKANDLAVLRTGNNFVHVNGLIEWSTLPEDDAEPSVGTFATTGGWGRIAYEGKTSQELYKVNGTFLSHSECSEIFGSIVHPDNSCFVAAEGKGVCDKDEGGPVMVNGVQIGLVSRSIGCDAYPAIVTRLGPHLEWIKDKFEA